MYTTLFTWVFSSFKRGCPMSIGVSVGWFVGWSLMLLLLAQTLGLRFVSNRFTTAAWSCKFSIAQNRKLCDCCYQYSGACKSDQIVQIDCPSQARFTSSGRGRLLNAHFELLLTDGVLICCYSPVVCAFLYEYMWNDSASCRYHMWSWQSKLQIVSTLKRFAELPAL